MTPRAQPSDQLDRAAVAALCGFKAVGTVNKYVERGVFPKADGHIGRSPWWYRETVEKWNRTQRRGRGQPSKSDR